MSEFYVHPNALCESENIGSGTNVWAFAHILPGARIGANCNICDGVFIEGGAVLGNDVSVKCGVQIWNGVELGDNVFVGPNATFTNDLLPGSKQLQEAVQRTVVESGASIGANATILAGLTIGAGAMIGAGSVVTRSIPPNAIVAGNPGRIMGYTTETGSGTVQRASVSPKLEIASELDDLTELGVNGVTIRKIPSYGDIRGALSVGEFSKDLPFVPVRYFIVYDVPSIETRGEHAHRRCHQFLICVSGSVRVLADDGKNRAEVILDSPNVGIHLPPMIWGTQYQYSDGAVLLVFASENYDSDEYIREYSEFAALTSKP